MLIRLTNFQQTFGMEYERLEDLVSTLITLLAVAVLLNVMV